MFFMKFFYFLKGYVIISLEGFSVERFINICIRRGIGIRRVVKKEKYKGTAMVTNREFLALRPIAFKTKTRVKILKKCGLPRILKLYKKRYVFPVGCLLFVLFFAVTSQFLWTVEINGTELVDPVKIQQVLAQAGVRPGVLKYTLPDATELKDLILKDVDHISWAWVYLEGTKARVEIKESILPPAVVDKSKPCDIIAMRDGLLKQVIVKEGAKAIEEGNAVMAGEVVIAGTLDFEEDGIVTVHALGTVEATTYHEKAGEYKLYQERRTPTGSKKTKYSLELFSKILNLYKNQEIPYEQYEQKSKLWELRFGKEHYLGISIRAEEYTEITAEREQIPYDTAVELAKHDLQEKIAKELLPGAILEKENLRVKQLDEETIQVTLEMEFTEKIGTEKPIE